MRSGARQIGFTLVFGIASGAAGLLRVLGLISLRNIRPAIGPPSIIFIVESVAA